MYTRDLLPSFAGVSTFAHAPEGTIESLTPGAVGIAGVAHDGTPSSRQGVRQGPRGIREASVDFVYDLYASTRRALVHVGTGRMLRPPAEGRLVDLGDLLVAPMDLARTRETCRRAAAAIIRRGAFPVVLGADHYVMEVAPNWDPTGRTRALAGTALIEALSPRIFKTSPAGARELTL